MTLKVCILAPADPDDAAAITVAMRRARWLRTRRWPIVVDLDTSGCLHGKLAPAAPPATGSVTVADWMKPHRIQGLVQPVPEVQHPDSLRVIEGGDDLEAAWAALVARQHTTGFADSPVTDLRQMLDGVGAGRAVVLQAPPGLGPLQAALLHATDLPILCFSEATTPTRAAAVIAWCRTTARYGGPTPLVVWPEMEPDPRAATRDALRDRRRLDERVRQLTWREGTAVATASKLWAHFDELVTAGEIRAR